MGTLLLDLFDHEGWAGRRLPDGTITGTWTLATDEFVAYRPQCECGWVGRAEYPPTEEGKDAAIDEWLRDHARPMLARQVPTDLAAEVRGSFRRLEELAAERPLAALEEARRLAKWADAISERAVRRARDARTGWTEIGQAAGTSAQAAQQRYGRTT